MTLTSHKLGLDNIKFLNNFSSIAFASQQYVQLLLLTLPMQLIGILEVVLKLSPLSILKIGVINNRREGQNADNNTVNVDFE